jgi:nucleotide-binding universal stress UspA family protein
VLVAVDKSEQAAYAAAVAARLARQLRAEVVLVNVFTIAYILNPEIGFIEPEIRAGCIEESDALLARFKAAMADVGNVETVSREGDAPTEILKAADAYEADLIVIGSHARGPVARALLGSTALAVSTKATCPVMTVSQAPADLDKHATARRSSAVGVLQ